MHSGLYHWENSAFEVLNYTKGVDELDPGTTYQLRVVAKNDENLEAPSEWLEFRTGGVGKFKIKSNKAWGCGLG